jgi:hypothetical protein
MQALRILKGLLWFVATYQFVVGALLLLTPQLAQLVVGLYGSDAQVTEQFTFILKPLGAYMVMTGLIAAASARADVPHPAIVTALSVLFGINVLYRVLRFQYIRDTFHIPAWHLTGQIVVLAGLGIALALLMRAASRATGASGERMKVEA